MSHHYSGPDFGFHTATRASISRICMPSHSRVSRANDARFVAVFAHELAHSGGYTPKEARRVARTLLPDMLSYRPEVPCVLPAQWPDTHRRCR